MRVSIYRRTVLGRAAQKRKRRATRASNYKIYATAVEGARQRGSVFIIIMYLIRRVSATSKAHRERALHYNNFVSFRIKDLTCDAPGRDVSPSSYAPSSLPPFYTAKADSYGPVSELRALFVLSAVPPNAASPPPFRGFCYYYYYYDLRGARRQRRRHLTAVANNFLFRITLH